jgi:hypothetical protein
VVPNVQGALESCCSPDTPGHFPPNGSSPSFPRPRTLRRPGRSLRVSCPCPTGPPKTFSLLPCSRLVSQLFARPQNVDMLALLTCPKERCCASRPPTTTVMYTLRSSRRASPSGDARPPAPCAGIEGACLVCAT